MLDEVFAGFGKYFSRFLYLLPDEVEKDLVAARTFSTEIPKSGHPASEVHCRYG
jgi:hypothetical protein